VLFRSPAARNTRGGQFVTQVRRRHDRRAAVSLVAIGALLSAGLAIATSPVHADEPPTEELIVNGGFEDGLTGWFPNNGNATDGATLTVTADDNSSKNAVAMTARQTTGYGPMQDLSGKLQAASTYTDRARIKYDNPASPATMQFFATMHYGGGTYTNVGDVVATRGQWGYINSTFTIPANQ